MNRIGKHYWMFHARSVTSFALAVFLLVAPGWSSLTTLAVAFGIWALVDGAGSLAFVLGAREVRIATYLGRGGLGIVLGVVALALPATSATSLYVLVGAWAIGSGALEMMFGARTWSVVPQALGFLVIGAQSLAFGLALLHIPLESVAILRGLLALFAIANGIPALIVGGRLHAPQAPLHAASP